MNLLGPDNYKQQEQVIEEAIRLLGDEIAVIHMKDFIVRDGQIAAVAAGTGSLDYKPIIRFIKERKPMLHCTLENTTPDNAVMTRKYIHSLYINAQ